MLRRLFIAVLFLFAALPVGAAEIPYTFRLLDIDTGDPNTFAIPRGINDRGQVVSNFRNVDDIDVTFITRKKNRLKIKLNSVFSCSNAVNFGTNGVAITNKGTIGGGCSLETVNGAKSFGFIKPLK